MTENALPIGGNRPGSPAWRRYWAEFCLLALVVTASSVVLFQHQLFARDIVVERGGKTPLADIVSYSDQVMPGGKSVATSKEPLRWSCALRGGASSIFCGYEIGLDEFGTKRGQDLTGFKSIALVVDYKGPPTTVRFHLKNEDPRYSTHGNRGTAKINIAEFSLFPGRNRIVLHPRDFSIPEWWLSQHHIPPELSRIQLDNVVSIEFMTGTRATPGDYVFAVRSVKVARSAIAAEQLYLAILGLLGVALLLYAAHRYRRVQLEARERIALEAQARDALADAAAAARQASQAKSDFLAQMSHELRTPLNAILGYAQLLERAPLEEKQMKAVRVINHSGNHLLSLITDSLDLARIEAGKMELHTGPCDLGAMIGRVEEMMRVPAEQKGLAFSCMIGDEVPRMVEADEKRLRQVLLNLLGNAVKFTAAGRVTLLVSARDVTQAGARLRFEVLDSGPGLSAEEIERIFRPFEQAGSVDRREAGTGLGLAITRQLVQLMESEIHVHSRVGQGSSFRFEIHVPVIEPASRSAAIDMAQVSRYTGARRRVLVVDDGEGNRALLTAMLGEYGFDCGEAENGLEALRNAARNKPDLILMDLKMPVLDGVEATRLIRMIEPLKDVPVIVISANVSDDTAASCLAAGANAFLPKPVGEKELLRVMTRVAGIEWISDAAEPATDNKDDAPQVAA